MKIKYFNTTTLIILILVILSACNTSTSIKGKWSKEDKEKFNSRIAEVLEDDEDYKEIKKDKESKKIFDKIIYCATEKVESKYNNYDEAIQDEAGLDKIGEKCATEVVEEYLKSAFDNLGEELNSELDASSTETSVDEEGD